MSEARKLLTAFEAAERLNVSEKTLWNHTTPRGKCIPVVKFGKTVHYCPAALDAWVATQAASGGKEVSNGKSVS
jgi:hypothetical protein